MRATRGGIRWMFRRSGGWGWGVIRFGWKQVEFHVSHLACRQFESKVVICCFYFDFSGVDSFGFFGGIRNSCSSSRWSGIGVVWRVGSWCQ